MPRAESAAARLRREVAEELVKMVTEALANGTKLPWRQPWVGGLGSHRNGRRGNKSQYDNCNAWMTWLVAVRQGYRSERWHTAEAGVKLGWSLPLGAPSATVLVPVDARLRNQNNPADHGVFRAVRVYSHEEFIGAPPEPPPPTWDGAPGVGRVIALLGEAQLDLRIAGLAYFARENVLECIPDHIGMPPAKTFHSPEGWAATALHELVHWTGDVKRLNRPQGRAVPGVYAMEELVAELGAAMLCNRLGIRESRAEDEEHAAYLTSWARQVKADPVLMERAVDAANAAAEFLEEIAPKAFALPDERAGSLAADVPIRLEGGHVWRADPAMGIVARAADGKASGPDAPAAAVSGFLRALVEWREGITTAAPVLLLAGAPGDGAETLLELAMRVTEGADAPAARVPAAREKHDRSRLPAWILPDATGRTRLVGVPSLPASEPCWANVIRLSSLPSPLALVTRDTVPPSLIVEQPWIFVADVARDPLPQRLARLRLTKTPSPVWTAMERRTSRLPRSLSRWSGRLGAGRTWLDGKAAGPIRRDMLTFREAWPFAPIVLFAAQAILDARARRGIVDVPLEALVDAALRGDTPRNAWQIIPLDVLCGRVFRSAMPTSWGSPSFAERLAFVVAMLDLCPELSHGVKGTILYLVTSLDDDVGQMVEDAKRIADSGAFGLRLHAGLLSRAESLA